MSPETFESVFRDVLKTAQSFQVTTYRPNALLSVKIQEGVLELSEETGWKASCKPLDDTTFLTDGGVVEFRKHQFGYILVWGKAAPYFPINATKWRENKVIEYLFTPYSS